MTKELTIKDRMRMDIEKFKEENRKSLDSFSESLESFENMKNKVQDKLHRCPELSSEEQEWVLQALLWAKMYLEYKIYSLCDARQHVEYFSKLISKYDEEIDN